MCRSAWAKCGTRFRRGGGRIVDAGLIRFEFVPERPQIGKLAVVCVDRFGRFAAHVGDAEQLRLHLASADQKVQCSVGARPPRRSAAAGCATRTLPSCRCNWPRRPPGGRRRSCRRSNPGRTGPADIWPGISCHSRTRARPASQARCSPRPASCRHDKVASSHSPPASRNRRRSRRAESASGDTRECPDPIPGRNRR